MYMPSIIDFLRPLTNTKNLIAIILVALFFGVWRISGGGVYSDTYVGKREGYYTGVYEHNYPRRQLSIDDIELELNR